MKPAPAQPPRASTFDPSDWRILAALWHPIAFAADVPDDGVWPARLLDVDLVVWRAASAPNEEFVVALDLDPVRGTGLASGPVVAGVLTAPLTRRGYGAGGACATHPDEPGLLAVRHRVTHGLIWACLAGAATHELPLWPELADTVHLKQMRLPPVDWACSVSREIENFMDVAHLSWLHTGTFGNRERPEIPAYQLEELPGGAGYRFAIRYPRRSVEAHGADAGAGQVEDLTLDYDLHLPFCTRLVIHFPDGTHYRIYNFPAPVSRRRCRIFMRMARDFDLSGPSEPSEDLQRRVLAEDQPMVEAQRPEEIPLDLTEEFHIAADRLSAAYRRALRELGLGHPLSS